MRSMDRNTVVVGVDRSDPARAAVEYAADLARRRHLRLSVVHAYEPSQYTVRPTVGWEPQIEGVMRNSAQRVLDDTVEVLGMAYPELDVTSRLEAGSPVAALLDESKTAESVVLGSRGAGGFAGLLLGSTTLHVAAHAECPVIAVPSPPDDEQPRHGVVVGVDGSELSTTAIEFALREASSVGEPLRAVHTWTDPSQVGPGAMLPLVYDATLVHKEELRVLAESMAGWAEKFPDVTIELKVVRGHPVRTLVTEAAGARLLVVGSHGRGAVRSVVLGSVGHGVLHHATGPVAVVHRTD